jgi:Holliday junction resolvase
MVKKYFKGYLAEWELTHKLSDMGFMVVRTPRSGRISLASPDIIAANRGKLIVIECKSRKSGFTVPPEQLNELKEWEIKAGARAYIGCKVARKGWFFLKLADVMKNNGNVGKKFLEEKSVRIEAI